MDPVWTGLVIGSFLLFIRFVARWGAGSAQQAVELGENGTDHRAGRAEPTSRITSPLWTGAALLFSFVLGAKLLPIISNWIFGREQPAIVKVEGPAHASPTEAQQTPGTLEETLSTLEANTAATIHRAELAEAKVEQQQCITLAKLAFTRVEEWEQEIKKWDEMVLLLLTNSDGELIAANADLVRQYRAILDQPRSNRQNANDLRQAIQALIEPVRLAFEDRLDAYKPEEATLTRLDELSRQALASRDEYRQARLQVESLLSTARARGVRAVETLQLASAAQKNQELSEANALLEREAEMARRDAAAAVAKAKADAIRLQGEGEAKIEQARAEAKRVLDEQEVQRIADESAAAKRKADQEMQTRLKQKEWELLQKEFDRDWPAMKTYLTPFVTPGVTQPTSGDDWSRQTQKVPVSFGALKAARVLESNFESLTKLMYKTSANGWNDRPMGGFPQYRGGDPRKSQELLQRIQDFLNKYGEVMVEKELLLP